MHELLTVAQMAQADALAVRHGVSSLSLMESAGRAVADEAAKMAAPDAPIVILCGPGNNGGDGFVAARLLAALGHQIQLVCLCPVANLKGDAAHMASLWTGNVIGLDDGCSTLTGLWPRMKDFIPHTPDKETGPLAPLNSGFQRTSPLVGVRGRSPCEASVEQPWYSSDGAEINQRQAGLLIIDALFGAGLSRAITGVAAELINRANDARTHGAMILAVDLPSGLDGNSGQPRGNSAITADRTVTFFRRKPAHVLLPGRALCGSVILADIGIPLQVLNEINRTDPVTNDTGHCLKPDDKEAGNVHRLASHLTVNAIDLWLKELPKPELEHHKYSRGAALVVSGPMTSTGAARLGAQACLRIGAGVVTLASAPAAMLVNASHLTTIMLAPFDGPDGLRNLLTAERLRAVLIGPGGGIGQPMRTMVGHALAAHENTGDMAIVLDADALTSFANNPKSLFDQIKHRHEQRRQLSLLLYCPAAATVLTPHEGEFARLFGDMPTGLSKTDRALQAAQMSNAIIVLKGPDTVIASPDGRVIINDNAPATLATAGSGDVLAGFITGLLAQGMPTFAAACAAVWLHGSCAAKFGPGLTALDIETMLPLVLSDFQTS